MALAGKRAKLVSYSSPIPFNNEPTTTDDDTVYVISDSDKRIWCKGCVITVLDGGVPTLENYEINRLEGAIIFESADNTRDITVSGEYLAKNDELNAFEYTYTLEASNEDSTIFGEEFLKRTQALKDMTASITRFYEDSNYFLESLLDDTTLVIEFYSSDSRTPDLRAWVKIASSEDSASVDGLIEESIELEGTTDKELRCVSLGL